VTELLEPTTVEDAAEALAAATTAGHAVRFRGGGTKLGWGAAVDEPDIQMATGALDQIVEHNAGDLTAVLQAGVPLANAQARFAEQGQILALDPEPGEGRRATIGGVVATGDSGPLRHRYGGVRDLVIGMTVALSDGTIARSGGKVIKNVAGYDLAKLFSGSFGTLGMILEVNVRLHPQPPASATALGACGEPAVLQAAAKALAVAPLELDALDIAWRGGRGGLLARPCGAAPGKRAERAARLMRDAGLVQVDVAEDDDGLWARQRAGQRSKTAALVLIATRPSRIAQVLRLTDSCGGTLVGRAALGTSYVECEPAAVERLRAGLPDGGWAFVLDGPLELRRDPWGAGEDGQALELMRRVKQRFDPARTCNPGVFVGGI
jgi:glycolate oxidase FAD binding subunit